ncbi:MAG: TIM barrel protein [Solirubrobacterales bacterium]|nr:TIM barrel protein [Solirubrobacterales bacterium]MCB8971165.1 TIM barrel protein [Thermoleophilales bacterium]MCO5325980.1 TIM barrel protein [Solirubrobacterales bacterium]
MSRTALLSERIAGAPISWGVCEVPGWGPMLEPEVVFADMAGLGLRATEVGPVGYLPADPGDLAERLARHGLRPIAAFVPVVFDPALGPRARERTLRAAAALAAAHGEVLMVAPVSDDGWSRRGLAAADSDALIAGLEELDAAVSDLEVTMALHPHVGSLVESTADIALVEGAEVGWCLDTGHLLIGGTDPVVFAARLGPRVVHVHLKDVDAGIAADVASGAISLRDGTEAGLFKPLGEGDVDVAAVLAALARAGYEGWYTLEQDTVLAGPDPSRPHADAERSLRFIRSLEERLH